MKRTHLFVIIAGAALLAGCDPGPSVPIAPEAKMPDTSKMSQDEIMKLREEGRKTDR